MKKASIVTFSLLILLAGRDVYATDFSQINLPYSYGGNTYTGFIKTVVNGDYWVELVKDNTPTKYATTTGTLPLNTIDFSYLDLIGSDIQPLLSDVMWRSEGNNAQILCTNPSFSNCAETGADYNALHFHALCAEGGMTYLQASMDIRDNSFGNCSYTTDYIGTNTRIVNIYPADGQTLQKTATSTPVDIIVDLYINDDDISGNYNVQVFIENIDQNTLFSRLSSFFGVGSYRTLYDEYATTSGFLTYATTTNLPEGNYRVHVQLDKKFGIFDIWTLDEDSSQFVVGSSTWLGNIRQNSFNQIQTLIGAKNATTTEATAATCNPFSGQFNIIDCTYFLFVPDSQSLSDSLESLKTGFLEKAPWGYISRFVEILTASTTTDLPDLSYTFGSKLPLNGETLTVSMETMLNEAETALDSIKTDNDDTFEDIMRPLFEIIVGMAVIFTIVSDLAGSHRHDDKNKPTS